MGLLPFGGRNGAYNGRMTGLTFAVGVLLVALGIVAYVATGAASVTALIPSFFGVIYIALAMVGGKSASARKHVMHVAAVLSVIGIAANVTAIASFAEWLTSGATLARPAAVYARVAMAAICAVHLIAAFRSFLAARLQPQA